MYTLQIRNLYMHVSTYTYMQFMSQFILTSHEIFDEDWYGAVYKIYTTNTRLYTYISIFIEKLCNDLFRTDRRL